MKQLLSILVKISVTLLIIVALFVSLLRFSLPHLDRWQQFFVAQSQYFLKMPIEMGKIEGTWKPFGPSLKLKDLSIDSPEIHWHVDSISLELDVWRSLLHLRWQFRDLTFYNMRLDVVQKKTNTMANGKKNRPLTIDTIADIFLRQFNYFDLRDSYFSFYSLSGQKIVFDIPRLTWLNGKKRHQAEGLLNLNTFNDQSGVLQVRLDLGDDEQSLLDNGTIYFQADNVDMSPWFSRWLRTTTGLNDANFSLSSWVTIKNGQIYGGDLRVKQGRIDWQTADEQHSLSLEDQHIQLKKQGTGWRVDLPSLNISIDDQNWPKGQLTALLLSQDTINLGSPYVEQLRLRATNIQLEGLRPLLPIFTFLNPDKLAPFLILDPRGMLDEIALDIPFNQPELTEFMAKWHNVSWKEWGNFPGIDHFTGEAKGSIEQGELDIRFDQTILPYNYNFKVPLEVNKASGKLIWQQNSDDWHLSGKNLDIQANSLWINGDFDFVSSKKNQSWLNILAGIRLYDAKEAWRYFPKRLMGKEVVDYLTDALQGGYVDNATLLFAGDPKEFPYKNGSGIFDVYVPLRQAIFQFQPDWLPLTDLSIDLDFLNDGLSMYANNGQLDKIKGSMINASIPIYQDKKLFIDAKLNGKAENIHHYLAQSPLKNSVGVVLDQLPVTGEVNGRVHLDIPINGQGSVKTSGKVDLKDSMVVVTAIDSTLENVTGSFTFDNGRIKSQQLTAKWLEQPIKFQFTNNPNATGSIVNLDLQGSWQLNKLPGLPENIKKMSSAHANWKSNVTVRLKENQKPVYHIGVQADVKQINEQLASVFRLSNNATLPIKIAADGKQEQFTLNGTVAGKYQFASEWQLNKTEIKLVRGVLTADEKPILPKKESLALALTHIDAEYWLSVFASNRYLSKPVIQGKLLQLPKNISLSTPSLTWLGQRWHELTLNMETNLATRVITADAKELKMKLTAADLVPWRADISYLYYNPQWPDQKCQLVMKKLKSTATISSVRQWPALELRCQDCWLMGQNLQQLEIDLKPEGDRLKLTHGLLNMGNASMSVDGTWLQKSAENYVDIKGTLKTAKIDSSLRHFGIITPLKGSSAEANFRLNWQGTPWLPKIETINGELSSLLGKGEIENRGGGAAGNLLRLVSVNALLRKLRFDFSDTFGEAFYFNRISGNHKIVNGVMKVDNLLIKGLSADIAISGEVDLVHRKLNLDAIVAPELSATVGVATAFVVNPVVGVAVFAASQALSPLWNKISFIRYKIDGDIDKPNVSEILRQPNEKKRKNKKH